MKLLLILCLINRAQVPEDTLKGAQKRVEEIYRHAGIEIEWRVSDAFAATVAERQTLTLTLVISPTCISGKTCRETSTMGAALVGRPGMPLAYVFADRVMDTTWKFQKETLIPGMANLLLSMSIAHEVGHLLLPAGYGHTSGGIMAERFDIQSIRTAMSGELHFLPAQEKLIRSAVRWDPGVEAVTKLAPTSSGWPSS